MMVAESTNDHPATMFQPSTISYSYTCSTTARAQAKLDVYRHRYCTAPSVGDGAMISMASGTTLSNIHTPSYSWLMS